MLKVKKYSNNSLFEVLNKLYSKRGEKSQILTLWLYDRVKECRDELMGIATISVFLCHLTHRFAKIGPGEILSCFFLFTYGFLFLSGFSISYSLDVGGKTYTEFIKRRIHNTYIPYLIVSLLPISIMSIIDESDVTNYVLRLSSLGFWFEGNICGTWYISVIMFLYVISPFANQKLIYTLFCLIFATCICLMFRRFYNNYYLAHSFISQVPAFFVGQFYQKYRRIIPTCIICTIFILLGISIEDIIYYEMCLGICITFIWTYLLGRINEKIKLIFRWLGQNSLMLYLIHIEVCLCLQTFGINPQISIIIGIVSSFILCKPFKKLSLYLVTSKNS